MVTVSPGLASKPVAWVSRFGPQNRQLRFGNLGLKITTAVSWFWPQNHVGDDLSIAPQNRWGDEDDVGHALRSGGLLHAEASRARVSQSALKTDGGAVWMVHAASSRRLRRCQVEDERIDTTGCVGLCYTCFTIFFILSLRDILVLLIFCLGL
jgi:hypothetical protein